MASTTGTSTVAPAGSANQQAGSARLAHGQAQDDTSAPNDMQLIRFPTSILANIPAPSTVPHVPGKCRCRSKFDIMGLPDDIFLMILKDHLSIFDRASLALVCKALAAKINVLPSMLRIRADNPEQEPEEFTRFLRKGMKKWFPGHLKYCQICGKYLPKDKDYWTETLHREFSGRAGMLARNFAAWSASNNYHSMEYHYRTWTGTCPRCKLHSRRY